MLQLTRKLGEGIKLVNVDTGEKIIVYFVNLQSECQGKFAISAPDHYHITRVDRHGENQCKRVYTR